MNSVTGFRLLFTAAQFLGFPWTWLRHPVITVVGDEPTNMFMENLYG